MEAKIVAAVYSRALSRPAVVVSHLTTHKMHIYYGLLPGHNVDRTKKSVREMKQPTLVCSYWVSASITNCVVDVGEPQCGWALWQYRVCSWAVPWAPPSEGLLPSGATAGDSFWVGGAGGTTE